jgi:uncharacterized membrane protein (DUF2068 family)
VRNGEAPGGLVAPPGTARPRRYIPRLRYELIDCGLHGHELLGTDAAQLRDEDALFAREGDGLRWYRCLRCDSWVALSPPAEPSVRYPPPREDVMLPLRGRALRDRYVLRLIALDRVLHFLVLTALAVALFLFARGRAVLNADFTRTEAVGLWLGRRWAEYLTFVATVVFVPYEIYELTKSITSLKLLTLAINLLIVIYLLFAKRLFGLRGGGKAVRAEREQDNGWPAIERATPGLAARIAPTPKGPAVSPD